MHLSETLDRAIKYYHRKTAIICGDNVFTYREFHERASRLASALQSLDIQKGDRVAYMMLNCHRNVEVIFAPSLIGGVIVPLNFRLAPAEISYMLNDSGAKVLVADETFLPMADAVRAKAETVQHFVFAGDHGGPGWMLRYEDLLSEAAPSPVRAGSDGDDLAGIFYTGGTTGSPKGVMLTHDNVMHNPVQMWRPVALSENYTYLMPLPLFHIGGLGAVFNSIHDGITYVPLKMFTPDLVFKTIERHKVSFVSLAPTMMNMLLNHPDFDKYDLSTVRLITYGVSPIAPDVLASLIRKLPNCRFMQAYGQTEASPTLTVLTPDDHVVEGPPEKLARLASGGRAIYGVTLRVVDEKGQDVKPGETGEVIAQGPNVMKGYWNRPEETAEALKDGWLHTGDMGTVDDEGYVFLVDRKKDMIVSGGENVYSTEVENVLYSHPAVLEAAVIGVPDAKWGEAVKAVVVLKQGHSATAAALIAHCRQQIAGFKTPKSVDFVQSLPKTAAGKISKREIREQFWTGEQRRVH